MSAVGLFTKDKKRYRFVTDYQFSVQQVQPTINRIMLKYEPETPTEILGNPLEVLQDIEIFACDYSGFFKTVGFATGDQGNVVTIEVLLNGVRVAHLEKNEAPGVLAAGQCNLDVSTVFANITGLYAEQVKTKQRKR